MRSLVTFEIHQQPVRWTPSTHWRIVSTDLPVVIEIVDSEEKVYALLATVDELVIEGLVTLEAVRIVRYVSPESR